MVEKRWPLLAGLLFLVGGCALSPAVTGSYYLATEKYEAGIVSLQEDFRKNPENPHVNYYLGRFHLGQDQPRKAIPYLESAALLDPANSDYHFWLGVAYSQNRQPDSERKSYEKALELDDRDYRAWTYLGHNLLEAKRYLKAQEAYTQALLIKPDLVEARFNRALAMQKLKRTPEEIRAWKDYLRLYPDGSQAREAAVYLNNLGDFEYRNSLIGHRRVTLRQIEFDPLTGEIARESRPTLDSIGDAIEDRDDIILHIVGYQKNNVGLAEKKVKNIKEYLLKKFKSIDFNQIKVSWFNNAERVRVPGRMVKLPESIHIFSELKSKPKGGES
ncbi:MAG: tetratricopeptide repeat protein [Deltaproteobacteria bacterium]|nr:tetratricopeptide repeat protein [Deltaproteobacteria bacterium]